MMLTRVPGAWMVRRMSVVPDDGTNPNTPSGQIAAAGRLARGLGQPTYRGSTFRVTVLVGLVVVFTTIVVVAVVLVRA